jgi:isochorismate synthase
MIGAAFPVLGQTPGDGRGLRRVRVPLQPISLEALFDALPAEEAVYWAADGETCVALGAVHRYIVSGADRFAGMRDATARLPAWARLFGGFAFAPAGSAALLPDGWAILPRFLLRRRGAHTQLTMTTDGHMPGEALTALALALTAARAEAPGPERAAELPFDALAHDNFAARVADARARIARGELDKVVLHRQTCVSRQGEPRARAALERLAVDQPRTARYAFRVGGRVFLGATPERLVSRRGQQVRADVLAGSLPRRDGMRPRMLLASAKDHAEHELTRRAIDEALRPFCRRLSENGPRVRTLPHLYHLHTAVRGVLGAPHHVLDLVAALHPTPAVGGVPRNAALAFLADAEPAPRQWYAGPVGWFRPDGDGDLRVALRCALLERDRATLFAGAGIVAGSDPQHEEIEVRWKERAMAAALGVDRGWSA